MSGRAIAASTLWQLASQILMAALSIATTKFVAVGLSQELAGNYNTAYGYLQFFGILADFGLYAVSVREVSRAKGTSRETVLGTLIVLRSIILLLSLGTALFFVWITPAWRGTPLPLSVTIASLVPLFTLMAGILRTVFQVTHRMHFVFLAEVTQRVTTASLIGLFILLGVRATNDTRILYTFLAIGGLGATVLFLLSLSFAGRIIVIRLRLKKQELLKALRAAAPYGAAFLCTALYRQFDVTLIAWLRPDFEIQNAYYGFAQRMMDMAYLLPTFLLNSTLPALAEGESAGRDSRDFLGKVLLAVLLLSLTSFLFAAFWARPLMELLTTEQYLATPLRPGSDTALRILSLSMFFNGIILFSFYSLLIRHVWQPLLWTLGAGVLLSLGGNVLLIPVIGFVGAAATSAIVHAALAILLLPQSLRILPVRFPLAFLRFTILYALLLAVPLALGNSLLSHPVITAGALVLAAGWMGVIVWVTGVGKAFRSNA